MGTLSPAEILRLDGSVAIVTGGGRGIGRAIARALAAAGARVVVTARTRSELDVTVEEIQSVGGEALAVAADVRRSTAVDAIVTATLDAFGTPDILVNNAGIQLTRKPFVEVTEEEWLAEFDANVHGVFRCCRAVGPLMLERGRGAVVNIASTAGAVGRAGLVGYTADKGAVIQLTRSLAREWAPAGIRVNGIGPGWIDTAAAAQVASTADLRARLLAQVPLGRIGRPEEVAWLALYLVSPAAALVTGQTFFIDGGLIA
ncbi:MAG: glucose 1-dehydrogenase [Candidatus Rokubacteria bacterium]|nr:glucose 1-dehydrogenase [Candidatus Rokubacteria bacterium]